MTDLGEEYSKNCYNFSFQFIILEYKEIFTTLLRCYVLNSKFNKIIIVLILLFGIQLLLMLLVNTDIDQKKIYEKRLIELIDASVHPTYEVKKIKSKLVNLVNFAKQYPYSKFADDAIILPILMEFRGSEDINKQNEYIERISTILPCYPNERIEPLTLEKIEKLSKGEINSPLFYTPYEYLPIHMKGYKGFSEKKFEEVVSSYMILKDTIDFQTKAGKALAKETYLFLAISFKELGKLDELKSISKEARQNIPESEIINLIEKVLRSTENN